MRTRKGETRVRKWGCGSSAGSVQEDRTPSREPPSYRRPLGGWVYLIKLGGHSSRKRVILSGTLHERGHDATAGRAAGGLRLRGRRCPARPPGSRETVAGRLANAQGADKPGQAPAAPPVPWGSPGRLSQVGSRTSVNT